MVSNSGILWIRTYLPLMGIQILWCPIQIGSDLNPEEKLNAVPTSDEWMHLIGFQGPGISTESRVKIAGSGSIQSRSSSEEGWDSCCRCPGQNSISRIRFSGDIELGLCISSPLVHRTLNGPRWVDLSSDGQHLVFHFSWRLVICLMISTVSHPPPLSLMTWYWRR